MPARVVRTDGKNAERERKLPQGAKERSKGARMCACTARLLLPEGFLTSGYGLQRLKDAAKQLT